ncbi:hypothetical protein [Hyalangium rubrum]|uniref:Uncharacterized protein n=1 Tax=Hyalangium rubrum TaxID=3103134 RepID=A0ABU5HE53_9BACT|nr:hypothetical protein [Hyalangium sp. s54d21]MDY7230380.1 hypothetical protein [Hyalangium sp. s54d21]
MERKLAGMAQQGIPRVGLQQWLWNLMWVLGVATTAACGPMEPGVEAEASSLETRTQAVKTLNGLSVNGLSVNGLSVNGLSVNGLSSVEFRQWFNQNPAEHDAVMEYVSLCAMPAGTSLTYLNPSTGLSYTWQGQLGLAPDWSVGQAPSRKEQQVVSACLAAHVNKFGKHVPLSVLGKSAKGVPIPFTDEELARFSERESCFFGNFFNGRGGFAANDRPRLKDTESTSRACGLASRGTEESCPAVAHVGFCDDFCTRDASSKYYAQCTYQGETFVPLTTRIKPQEIFTCGDGVCQFTESCGNGSVPGSCKADCGRCG